MSGSNSKQIVTNGTPEAQAAPEEVNLLGLTQITERIAELQADLAAAVPGYEGKLQTIHRMLSQDEALTHMLTDEQVGVICAGLTRKKNIIITMAAVKGGGTGKKQKLSDIDADDL